MNATNPAPADPHPALALLAHEARVRYAPTPREIAGIRVVPGGHFLSGDEFLIRTQSGYSIHYRRGHGVTVEASAGADPAEEALWLDGSVYAAIACINGLMPIHASAVAYRGRVHAFSGASGAGKSTLSAGLGQHGLPLYADDTLVLDISDPAAIVCLPGHKRLKLSAQAIGLTGSAAEEKVGPAIAKFYALPPGGIARGVLPLATLSFIEDNDGGEPAFTPITGAQRIARLNDDHYTADLFALARGLDPAARFACFAGLAPRIAMHRFTRPRDPARFAETSAAAAAFIHERSI